MNELTERELKIISILMEEDRYMSSDELSSRLEISAKTIQREIAALNEILITENCAIDTVRSKGYRIAKENKASWLKLFDPNHDSQSVIPTMQKTRLEWLSKKFVYLSFNDQAVLMQELCEELYISMATLKKDLKELKKQLSEYDLQIVKEENKGLRLKGSEQRLRKLLIDQVAKDRETFGLKEIVGIDEQESHFLHKAILEAVKEFKIAITDVGFTNLLMHVEIAISRIRSQKMLYEDFSKWIVDQESDEYACSVLLCQKIEATLKCAIPQSEVVNIYQHLIAQKRILNKQSDIKVNQEMLAVIEKTLKQIQKAYQSDFSKDHVLIYGLLAHLESALNRIRLSMRIRNDMLDQIKLNYPFPLELANLLAKNIEKQYQVEINQDEVGFLALHFCGAIERLNLREEKFNRVLLVCSTGIGTSLLLRSKITARFKKKIEIVDVCAMYQIEDYASDTYDFIISTIPLKETVDHPWVVVTPLFTEQDAKQVENYLKFGSDDSVQISDLFSEDLFFAKLDLTSREAVIDFMAEKLYEKGYIDQQCRDGYRKRESMATTEIGNLMSVPHSMEGTVYKNAIAVAILKNPIHWEYDEVQIVLMIAIKKEAIHKENEFFLHIYQKFDPLYKAKKMISENSIEFIKQQFNEEEII